MSEDAAHVPGVNTAAPGAARLSRGDIRTLVLSALGGTLEFYDFVVFVFFAIPLGHLFFPADTPPWLAQMQVFGIFAAGYLARPLGGVVMAHFGDTLGRKRMFMLSVFLMALPTLAIGLLPVYAQVGVLAPVALLALRVVQGIAVGGEVPGAWVFVAEHAPRGRTEFACASLTSGLTAGILLGSLSAALINARLTSAEVLDYGWRLPFIAGGVFGFVAVWLRETPVFEALRARKALAHELPLRVVLRDCRGGVVRSMLVTWMLTAAIVVVILMAPVLVQSLFHMAPARAFAANSLASLMLAIGCLAFGALTDRVGAARALAVGVLALAVVTYALLLDLRAGGAHFTAWYALDGFCVGVVGVVPVVMIEAFPAAVRFSGLAFSYNIAYALFGGFTPPMVSYLVRRFGVLAPAHYVAWTAWLALAVAAWLIWRQPRRA